jgi:hypothetical protein
LTGMQPYSTTRHRSGYCLLRSHRPFLLKVRYGIRAMVMPTIRANL